MDLIASAARLPARGESVTGGAFAMAPGGKGGNQACQLARCGVHTLLVSRVGDDLFGRELLAAMQSTLVDTSLITVDREYPTGASTVLAAEGDYASIIVPGAAGRLSGADIDAAGPAIDQADAVVLQLELPVAISTYAAELATRSNTLVVLNASPVPDPVQGLPRELWRATSVLVVNRVEAGRLLGSSIEGAQAAGHAALELNRRFGIETTVITLGAEGAVAAKDGSVIHQPAFPALVIDTVGAGDAFLGVFVAGLIEGTGVDIALERAAAAGALAVGHSGAFDALPSRSAIVAYIESGPKASEPSRTSYYGDALGRSRHDQPT
jgi:ribokinase